MTCPRGCPTRPPRWPATSASDGSCASTTTTTSRSTGPPSCSLSDDAAARFDVLRLARRAPRRGGRRPRRARSRPASEPSAEEDRPSLVIVRSHIAYPSPSKTDDPATHGYALKDAEISEAKAVMGLPDEAFYVPDDVRALYRTAGGRGRDEREAWQKRLDAYDGDHTALTALLGATGAARLGRCAAHVGPRRQGGHPRGQRAGAASPRRRRPRPPGRRRRPHVEHRHRAEGPRRAVRRRARPGGSCTSASASTRWPPP